MCRHGSCGYMNINFNNTRYSADNLNICKRHYNTDPTATKKFMLQDQLLRIIPRVQRFIFVWKSKNSCIYPDKLIAAEINNTIM